MRGLPVDFCFNADLVSLKLVTHKKFVFRAGAESCKRKARCVAVTDLFGLINVSSIKARCSLIQFTAANKNKSNSW